GIGRVSFANVCFEQHRDASDLALGLELRRAKCVGQRRHDLGCLRRSLARRVRYSGHRLELTLKRGLPLLEDLDVGSKPCLPLDNELHLAIHLVVGHRRRLSSVGSYHARLSEEASEMLRVPASTCTNLRDLWPRLFPLAVASSRP